MGRGAVRRALESTLAVVVVAVVCSCATSGGGEPEDESPSAPTSAAPTTSGPPPSIQDAVLEAGVTGSGLPEGVTPPDDGGSAGAGWAPDDGLLYVVTFGSSTCPVVAEPAATLSGDTLVVTAAPTSDGPCTMDLVPTTSVVGVPDDVDASAPVTVDLGDLGVVTVEPRGAAGSAGPIAWVSSAG